jgi:hypothetical protein
VHVRRKVRRAATHHDRDDEQLELVDQPAPHAFRRKAGAADRDPPVPERGDLLLERSGGQLPSGPAI